MKAAGVLLVAARGLPRCDRRRRYGARRICRGSSSNNGLKRLGEAPRGAAPAEQPSRLVITRTGGEAMSSRDDILASIRANLPRVDRPLPHVRLFDDEKPASLLSAFKDSLHRMGGVFLDPPAPATSWRRSGEDRGRQNRVLYPCRRSLATGYRRRGPRHELADVDFAVVRHRSPSRRPALSS